MASEGNIKYLQYILLLGEGSKLVLQGLVDREVRKKQTTLKQILDNDRNLLRRRFKDDVQFQRIYPCDGPVNSDVNSWDIALLAKVILFLFGSTLTWSEKASVRFLKDMRNEVQAHASSMSLQNEEFQSMWSELSTTLRTLASSLRQEIQDGSEELIKKLSTGLGDLEQLKTKIEQLAKYDEHFQNAMKLIGDKIDSELGHVAEKIEKSYSVLHTEITSSKDDIENKIQSTSKNTCELIEHQSKTVKEMIHTKTDEVKDALSQAIQSTSGIQADMADASSHLQSLQSEVSHMQGNFSIFGGKIDGVDMKMDEMCNLLKSLLSEGREFRQPQVVGAEVNVEGPDEELTSKAEEQLLKAFEKAKSSAMKIAKRARQSNDPDAIDELEKVVKEFLDRIESIEDVQADEVQKHCILLSIKCTSGAGMLALLRILTDGSIQDKLNEIAKVLISHYGGKFRLTSRIVPESVQKAIDHLSHDTEVPVIKRPMRSMNIPVRCNTLAGLAEVCNLFSEKESVPYFENISAALSRKLGRKIVVKGSLNSAQVTEALRNVDSQERVSIEKQASHDILETTSQRRRESSHAAEGSTPRHKPYKLKSHRQVNIRTSGDKKMCKIYGCCSLPDGNFLLADHSNKRLKRLNKVYEVVDNCLLPSNPWDVCYAGDSEAVVSLNNNSLQFVNVDGQMTLTRTVKFAHPCWGVTKSADRLYIKGGASVFSYTQDGDDKHILYTDPSRESSYQHLEANDKGSKIYITGDTDAFTALVLDQEGKVLNTFTDSEKKGSSDICLDGDGNVYLCGERCKTIVQLDSETLEKVSDIITPRDEVSSPWCICFDRDHTALIVGHLRSDTITVVDLQT